VNCNKGRGSITTEGGILMTVYCGKGETAPKMPIADWVPLGAMASWPDDIAGEGTLSQVMSEG